MGKNLKPFSASEKTLNDIEASDKVNDLRAAGYRFEARMADLERQFEEKAGELRLISRR